MKDRIEEIFDQVVDHSEPLRRFAELIAEDAAAKEREACVKIALKYEPTERSPWVQYAADEMRARGEK